MRTRHLIATTVLAALLFAAPTLADDKVIFYEDPLFKPLNDGDEHPMADLIGLAEGGDLRAQFIMGDLYAKGKGGLAKNTKKARHWFNQSAINGYGASFIRLGALARHEGDMTQAYSWYDLGASLAGGKDARYSARARDQIKLSGEDKAKANELSSAWRKEKAKALSDKTEAEKAQREEQKTIDAAKKAADEKDSKTAVKTANKKQDTQTPAKPAVKERRYND